jgi:hypothetical protein
METFGHVKTVIAIILGLSITHLLKGAAKLIQHPGRDKPYWIHLLWALYVFLLLVHFWWWEYHLNSIQRWVFPEYFFVITYITIYYVLCALLFPDDLRDYKGGFEEYFYSRKKWFFSVLALSFVADVVDTLIKGKTYFLQFRLEYPLRNVSHILLCLAALWVKDKRFHAALVILFILYELSYILRLFLSV